MSLQDITFKEESTIHVRKLLDIFGGEILGCAKEPHDLPEEKVPGNSEDLIFYSAEEVQGKIRDLICEIQKWVERWKGETALLHIAQRRADDAEAELERLYKQEPAAFAYPAEGGSYLHGESDDGVRYGIRTQIEYAVDPGSRKLYASPVPATWQPIETAPTDGTAFIGYRNGMIGDAYKVQRDDCEMWYFRGTSAAIGVMPNLKPTHWMPKPVDPR